MLKPIDFEGLAHLLEAPVPPSAGRGEGPKRCDETAGHSPRPGPRAPHAGILAGRESSRRARGEPCYHIANPERKEWLFPSSGLELLNLGQELRCGPRSRLGFIPLVTGPRLLVWRVQA